MFDWGIEREGYLIIISLPLNCAIFFNPVASPTCMREREDYCWMQRHCQRRVFEMKIKIAILGSILGTLLIAATIMFVAYQLGIFVPPIDIFGGMKTPESSYARTQLQLIWHTPLPRQFQALHNPLLPP